MAMVQTENDSIQFGITQTQIICGRETCVGVVVVHFVSHVV